MIFLKNSLAAAFPEKLLEILIKSSVFFAGAGELSDAKNCIQSSGWEARKK